MAFGQAVEMGILPRRIQGIFLCVFLVVSLASAAGQEGERFVRSVRAKSAGLPANPQAVAGQGNANKQLPNRPLGRRELGSDGSMNHGMDAQRGGSMSRAGGLRGNVKRRSQGAAFQKSQEDSNAAAQERHQDLQPKQEQDQAIEMQHDQPMGMQEQDQRMGMQEQDQRMGMQEQGRAMRIQPPGQPMGIKQQRQPMEMHQDVDAHEDTGPGNARGNFDPPMQDAGAVRGREQGRLAPGQNSAQRNRLSGKAPGQESRRRFSMAEGVPKVAGQTMKKNMPGTGGRGSALAGGRQNVLANDPACQQAVIDHCPHVPETSHGKGNFRVLFCLQQHAKVCWVYGKEESGDSSLLVILSWSYTSQLISFHPTGSRRFLLLY